MLPKRQRLSRSEFAHLLRVGRRIHTSSCTLIYTPASTLKAGVVVSKKTARKATQRNLMRRRVYTILREHVPTLPPLHIAVLLKVSAATLLPAHLKEELVEALKRVTTDTP